MVRRGPSKALGLREWGELTLVSRVGLDSCFVKGAELSVASSQ